MIDREWGGAEEPIRRAIEFTPNNPRFHFNMAVEHYELRRRKDFLETLKKVEQMIKHSGEGIPEL